MPLQILSLLLSAGPDDAPIVTEFILDEESILRILLALKPIAQYSDETIVAKVRKISYLFFLLFINKRVKGSKKEEIDEREILQVVYQTAAVKPAHAYKKMLLLRDGDDMEFNQVLESMVCFLILLLSLFCFILTFCKLSPDVPQELMYDFRKWTDKDTMAKKDFHTLSRDTFKQKQEVFSKTQAAIRFNKNLVNTTMANLHVCIGGWRVRTESTRGGGRGGGRSMMFYLFLISATTIQTLP